MAETKTKATEKSVTAFLQAIPDERKRSDAFALVALMRKVTRTDPKMWGTAIVGFGSRHYKYASGHEGDTCVLGFSPRKEALALYIMGGHGPHADLLKTLGKHKTGKGCLYVKTLEDVKVPVLEKILRAAVKEAKGMGVGE